MLSRKLLSRKRRGEFGIVERFVAFYRSAAQVSAIDACALKTAMPEIIRVSGNKSVELETADLSSQAQIRSAATSIRGRHKAILALINNAAVSLPEHHAP